MELTFRQFIVCLDNPSLLLSVSSYVFTILHKASTLSLFDTAKHFTSFECQMGANLIPCDEYFSTITSAIYWPYIEPISIAPIWRIRHRVANRKYTATCREGNRAIHRLINHMVTYIATIWYLQVLRIKVVVT